MKNRFELKNTAKNYALNLLANSNFRELTMHNIASLIGVYEYELKKEFISVEEILKSILQDISYYVHNVIFSLLPCLSLRQYKIGKLEMYMAFEKEAYDFFCVSDLGKAFINIVYEHKYYSGLKQLAKQLVGDWTVAFDYAATLGNNNKDEKLKFISEIAINLLSILSCPQAQQRYPTLVRETVNGLNEGGVQLC